MSTVIVYRVRYGHFPFEHQCMADFTDLEKANKYASHPFRYAASIERVPHRVVEVVELLLEEIT